MTIVTEVPGGFVVEWPVYKATYLCLSCEKEFVKIVGAVVPNSLMGMCCPHKRALLLKYDRVVRPSIEQLREFYGP